MSLFDGGNLHGMGLNISAVIGKHGRCPLGLDPLR